MLVRELIEKLLHCDMNDDVEILLEKGKSVRVYMVHSGSQQDYRNSGVLCVSIEPIDDLKRLDE